MINMDYIRNKAMYKAEPEMSDYVTKYAKKNSITIDEALSHIAVTMYREYLQGGK